MSAPAPASRGAFGVREATPAELADWDRHTVHAPGGHVYQSLAWARERARLGLAPAVCRARRRSPGAGPRPRRSRGSEGPAPTSRAVRSPIHAIAGPVVAARTVALADWLATNGVDVVATDAEIPASVVGVREALGSAGFHPIPEIQPSRHRISLLLAADTDDAAVRAGIAKSTRQRIAAAERDALVVTRYDTAGWAGDHPLFARPLGGPAEALGRFATLLEGTGERRGFRFGPRAVFLDWWKAAHEAGLLVYLEAHDDRDPDRTLGWADPLPPRRAALHGPLRRRAGHS